MHLAQPDLRPTIRRSTVSSNWWSTGSQGLEIGPLANARRREAVAALVDGSDAKVHCGGVKPEGRGFFYPPTVLTDVPAGAAVLRDEPFGPIMPILPFGEIEDGLAQANAVPYGLAAYVFTT